MKQHTYFKALGWFAGAAVWAWIAHGYTADGRTGFAVLQWLLCAVFVLRGILTLHRAGRG